MLNNQTAGQSRCKGASEQARYPGIQMQYAAICFREAAGGGDHRIKILLITSRDTGRWVILKGWPMRKKKPYEVASIEAWQEAGVRGAVRKKVWGSYAYLKKMKDGQLLHTLVEVHLLHVEEMDSQFPERKQRLLRWFSPADAASALREPGLGALLSKLDACQSRIAVC
ncbi:NUDIX hydrolase [Agrobacterium sp. V1]|uniref:NUDIX hydrolase n=1 Tax=Agrobacterium sp. V1 TaxID=3061957 RepID=UPI002670E861|nr:NUDIX hydrolase [Agrobacterium sp. V1]MDO3445454.1 NUDIX hydrolase [Agrobacterium sp. V1]